MTLLRKAITESILKDKVIMSTLQVFITGPYQHHVSGLHAVSTALDEQGNVLIDQAIDSSYICLTKIQMWLLPRLL